MKYDKKQDTSYSIGMFATIELLENRIDKVKGVYYSQKIKMNEVTDKLFNLCKKHNILVLERTKFVESVAGKENVFVVGEFYKYDCKLDAGNQLVLVNPSDMGNLGTIVRTSLGFNVKNIAIIKPCVDYFDPKVIRASQGAIFKVNIQAYSSYEEYKAENSRNNRYMFCLDGATELQTLTNKKQPFALVFGNEASGLPESVTQDGEPVKIRQSDNIDSFNLAISVAMGLYEFTK